MLDIRIRSAFEAVFDALDVGIVVLDGQGRMVGWNDWIAGASRRFQGYRRSAKTFFEIFPAVA